MSSLPTLDLSAVRLSERHALAFLEEMGAAAGRGVVAGALDSLRALVEEGLDVTITPAEYQFGKSAAYRVTLLVKATSEGQKEVAEYLVGQGLDPLILLEGVMPHHLAALHGHTAVLEWLLAQFSILLDVDTSDGSTALYLSAANRQMETVRLLI